MIWTDEIVEDVKKKWMLEGKSAGQIAKDYGITRNTVMGKLKRLKLLKERAPDLYLTSLPKPAPLARHCPATWDEKRLTEPWTEYRARKRQERQEARNANR